MRRKALYKKLAMIDDDGLSKKVDEPRASFFECKSKGTFHLTFRKKILPKPERGEIRAGQQKNGAESPE